jgi:hypothetical protein
MKKGCYSLEKKRQKDTGKTGDSPLIIPQKGSWTKNLDRVKIRTEQQKRAVSFRKADNPNFSLLGSEGLDGPLPNECFPRESL